MKTLKDLFLEEVADMYDAERRTVKALPKLAKAATCEKLKAAFLAHLKETEGHVTKHEQVFQSFEQKPKGMTCKATVGLLEEGAEIATEFKGAPALNAALISAAQKVEHHEIAAYGALHEWAGLLGNQKAAGLLEEILKQEKAANAELTKLALASSNPEVLGGCDSKNSTAGTADPHPANLRRGIRPVSTSRNRVPALV
jgi:ferritin-like metal-binding protein YciE